MQQDIHFCKTADNVRIAYATVGEGMPLIKAANWLNHLEFDWKSPVWQSMFEDFAQNHLFVRYDERGNGLSDWNAAELSFESFVRDLESVADAVGLQRFALLGISQGGAVAAAYAVRHPERVTHLILYGAYALGWEKRGSTEEIERRQAQLTLIKLGWGQDNPAFRQLWTSIYMPDAPPEQMKWFNDLQRITTSPENAARLLKELGKIDVLELLPQIKTPTLVLHCRDEAAVPFEEGRRLAALIPGARFVQLESRNHLLHCNEPAYSTFMIEVQRFLGTDREATTRRLKPPQPTTEIPLKSCPVCRQVYTNQRLKFCRADGALLVEKLREAHEKPPHYAAITDGVSAKFEILPSDEDVGENKFGNKKD